MMNENDKVYRIRVLERPRLCLAVGESPLAVYIGIKTPLFFVSVNRYQ